MSSRKIEDCAPELQEKYRLFDAKMNAANIDYILTCTIRTQAEQDALYAQGRTMPGKLVTWTRKSKHILGKAFDIAILICGKICWNPELDEDKDGVPEYTEAGRIGESVGLKWGGNFTNQRVDAPHFEID